LQNARVGRPRAQSATAGGRWRRPISAEVEEQALIPAGVAEIAASVRVQAEVLAMASLARWARAAIAAPARRGRRSRVEAVEVREAEWRLANGAHH
jgi:hypothetical protein